MNTTTHENVLTYPISPDYVRDGHGGTGWTPERAIAEFIANALDEDRGAQVTYAHGVLTIEDWGPGIPEEGLLLGYSPKTDEQIGQFGEGSKIGALVLARDPNVGKVLIETVGYAIIPTVERRRILDGIAPRRSDEAPEVLTYTFVNSTRTKGTKVTIEVDEATANAARARFRHLDDPTYTPPVVSQVITDGTPGRLYIGGVLVSTRKDLLFSYDFPLAEHKTSQNRDRTVIDASRLDRMVRGALKSCEDRAVHEKFVAHALAGKKIAPPEQYFYTWGMNPVVTSIFRDIARDTFQGRSVFWTDGRDLEAAVDLTDGTSELLETNLPRDEHRSLMMLLGVPKPKAARAEASAKSATQTVYVADSKLTDEERESLEAAKAEVTAVFGPQALGLVRVYSSTGQYMACANGFYTPRTGTIALHRDILTDPFRTLEVLLHEAAHRRAHREGREYHDRTRGFENMLGQMLAEVMVHMLNPNAKGVRVFASHASDEPTATELTAQAPEERRILSDLLHQRFEAIKDTYKVTRPSALMRELTLPSTRWRLIAEPHPVGWRTSAHTANAPLVKDYDEVRAIARATGLFAPAVWIAHVACEAPTYRGRTKGKWKGRLFETAQRVADDLQAADLADEARTLREQSAGEGEPDALTALAVSLIKAEAAKFAS